MKRKPKRKPASKHLTVIDNLLTAIDNSRVNKVVVSELVDVGYVTLDKYLRKERNVNNEVIAKRMVVVTDLLQDLVKAGILPIADEVNLRLRTSVMLETIDNYIKRKNETTSKEEY